MNAKKINKNHKFSKIKGFLFFLVLAIIFWALTKFSREFTTTVFASVHYANIPETTALAANNVDEISFDLTANGFDLLFYKIKKPTIKVDVASHYTKGNYEFTLSGNQLNRLIKDSFGENVTIKNRSNEKIIVELDPIVFKKVRVLARVDITFAHGFEPVDTIHIKPDSVTIYGPSGSLKDILFVETLLVSAKNLDEDLVSTTGLLPPSKKVITVSPAEVVLSLKVAEFSEGQVIVPIEVINLPPNMNLKIIPETVVVSYNASIKMFNSVSEKDFRVICDFSERNKEENFMIPKLDKKPKEVLNHEFDINKVDFLVLK